MIITKLTAGSKGDINNRTGLESIIEGLSAGSSVFSPMSQGESFTVQMGLASSTLPKTHDKLTSRMLNLGGVFKAAGSSYPNDQFITNDGTIDYGTGTVTQPRIVKYFVFCGVKFEFKYKEVVGSLEVIADGVSEFNSIPTTTGQIKFASVTFSSAKPRVIAVIGQNCLVGDFYTETSDSVVTPKIGRKIIIAGDSYTEGTGADFGLGYVNRLMSKYNIYNVVNSGLGGTGYLKENSGRPNLISRYQTDIIDQNPDVVIIAMGINDLLSSPTDIATAASTIISDIKVSNPNCEILILGCWYPRAPTQEIIDINTELELVSVNGGAKFINPTKSVDESWVYGTGRVGAEAGDGNADVITSSDNTHPTNLGHEYLASMLKMSIDDAGVLI